MKSFAQTVIVFLLMILFSVTGVSAANARGIGECGELKTDCFTRAYVGAGFGINSLDSKTLTESLFVFDDSALTSGLVAGYRFNKFFGVEAFANDFGKHNYYISFTNVSVRTFNIGLGANLYFPIGEFVSDSNLNFVSFLVNGGINYWDQEAEADNIGTIVYTNEGVNFYYGVGLNVDIFRYITLRADYTIFNLDEEDSIDNGSLKMIFKF